MIKDRSTLRVDNQFRRPSIDRDLDRRPDLVVDGDAGRRIASRIEELVADLVRRYTAASQYGTSGFNHACGPAEVPISRRGCVDDCCEQLNELALVESALEHRYHIGFTTQDVEEHKTPRVVVLQSVEVVEEHDRAPILVAVYKGEPALGFIRENRFDHRQDGRDAAAGNNRDVVALVPWICGDGELTGRGGDLDYIPCLELSVRERREHTTAKVLDADL